MFTTKFSLLAVSGHDVSEECLRRQFQQSKEFFALPLADKLRVRVRSAACQIAEPFSLLCLSVSSCLLDCAYNGLLLI